MPLDPSIYRVPPPEPIDPMAILSRTMQMQNLMAQGQQQREDRQALARQRSAAADQTQIENNAKLRADWEEQQLRALFKRGDVKPEEVYQIVGPERGMRIVSGLSALQKTQYDTEDAFWKHVADATGGIKALPPGLRVDGFKVARQGFIEKGVKPESIPDSDDPTEIDQIIESFQQRALTPDKRYDVQHPRPVAPEKVTYNAPQLMQVRGKPMPVRAGSDGKIYDLDLRPIPGTDIQAPPEPQKAPGSFEQQIADALAKGDQQTVDRLTKAAELAAGARSRTQGRPVTAGNAEELADFDTSLDDLEVLRAAIAPLDPKTGQPVPGVTGARAQIGAAMPAWATDIFGWGTDAKKKQALIDRVKQVIGKTLEGGVLRKEDEVKYEKILPTIKDANEIVISKLGGLDAAIAKRKERRLEALEDANYDVSKFRARGRGAQSGSVPAGVLSLLKGKQPGRYTLSDGSVWQVPASGAPTKVQ